VARGGTLIYNASLVTRAIRRDDIRIVAIPASEVAARLGEGHVLNMVLLGALIECISILPLDVVEQALEQHLSAHHRELLELNWQALRRGAQLERELLALA